LKGDGLKAAAQQRLLEKELLAVRVGSSTFLCQTLFGKAHTRACA
jgi:hypothetical protein